MSNNALFRMKRSVKIGTYSFVMGVVVLAVLLVANLLVGALPAKVTRFSLTDQSISDISDETVKFVSEMKEDVTIYWLCEGGTVDEELELFFTRYVEAGKHIKLEVVDPLTSPTFTAQYTEDTLTDYSIIVESARRHTVVDFMDMYYYSNSLFAEYMGLTSPLTIGQLTSLTEQYSDMFLQYMQVDVSQYTGIHSFCGEARLTSALDFVTKEEIPHAYVLTGHGDTAHSETLAGLLTSMNMDIEELNLQIASKVPTDANCLILFSPKSDISTHEATLIKEYLNAGGSLMLTTSPELVASCPNIMSLGEVFGLSAAEGLVQEGDTGFISGSQYTLVPTVNTEHTATSYVSSGSYKPQMPQCHAITVAETLPAGVTVTPLFTTSEKANRVSVADTSVTLGEAGKLHVAVAASKSITTANGTTVTADMTWYGSTAAFTDAMAETTSGGNYYYYGATLGVMSESFSSAYEALSSVVFTSEYLTGLTNLSFVLIGVITVLLIPALLLGTGIVIWVVRKRR